MLDNEGILNSHIRDNIPRAWATLEQDIDVTEKRTKITLRLDVSVAQFYRAMGNGYQARINRVLATYAQLRISQLAEFDELMAREHPVEVAF